MTNSAQLPGAPVKHSLLGGLPWGSPSRLVVAVLLSSSSEAWVARCQAWQGWAHWDSRMGTEGGMLLCVQRHLTIWGKEMTQHLTSCVASQLLGVILFLMSPVHMVYSTNMAAVHIPLCVSSLILLNLHPGLHAPVVTSTAEGS